MKESRTKTPEVESNIFRDSLWRYLGYANEVGESFRYLFPRLVGPSYAVAFGYCLADATYSGYRTYQRSDATRGALQFADTMLWQTLASVMIPGGVIFGIVRSTRLTLSAVARSPHPLIPTAVGLASIPVIIRPIDALVDVLLDHTTRQWMSSRDFSEES